jgi:hypothetical protein
MLKLRVSSHIVKVYWIDAVVVVVGGGGDCRGGCGGGDEDDNDNKPNVAAE